MPRHIGVNPGGARLGPAASALGVALCLALVFSAGTNVAAPTAAAEDGSSPHPIMRPDPETLEQWVEAYNSAPIARAAGVETFQLPAPGGSLSLLSHLDYTPSERHQGSCSNCWAWAGTGCLGIALDVQEGIEDRLSVQYINSCQNHPSCCAGGWLEDFADFYDPPSGTGRCLPWSNSNAHWQDGDASCDTSCGSISTSPDYPISSIQDVTIETQTVDQAAAIANIKDVLHQDTAVWFGFFVPDSSAWSDFCDFWDNSGESMVYEIDQFCGAPSGIYGGHAVLCVGYDDADPDPHWVMLNSWGTAGGGRPNGLFRVDMDMAYDCSDGPFYYFYWQTLDVDFVLTPGVSTDAATAVEETTATLNGTVTDDRGEPCQYRFAYGTAPGGPYASYTDWSIDTRTTGQSFTEDISSLAEGTKYYYVAEARNGTGTGSGSEESFVTRPDEPAGFTAAAAGATCIDLSWTKGDGAGKTMLRRSTASFPAAPDEGEQAYFGTGSSHADSGLWPDTHYYYSAWSWVEGSDIWSDACATADATTPPCYDIPISGVLCEVNCAVVAGADVTLYQGVEVKDQTTSAVDGSYNLTAPQSGSYTLVAGKTGFRDRTLPVQVVADPLTVDFCCDTGLMPEDMEMSYVLQCVNHWLYPAPPCGLGMSSVLAVVNAWLYPLP